MSFSTILAAAKVLASILPLISGLVQQVETDLAGVAGATKLAAVLAQVNAFIGKITNDVNVISAVQSSLTPLINELVAIFNATGVFKTAVGSAAATAPAPTSTGTAA